MVKEIRNMTDLLDKDLAVRHKWTTSSGTEALDPVVVEHNYNGLMRDGYVIMENLLTVGQLAEIRANVEPLLQKTGRNTFEGAKTQRAYNVLKKTRVADAMAEHPRVLALLDRLLMQNYLLSQVQVIKILPGEARQLLHTDDSPYLVPRPRKALGAATVWAIDDFTADNGATVVVPGSHVWGNDREPMERETIPCVMPAGSVVMFLGTLWHGGGANWSNGARLGVTCQYCEPWLRQQENFMAGIPKSMARELPENLLRMIGYSICAPFFGMVDGMHPRRLLE